MKSIRMLAVILVVLCVAGVASAQDYAKLSRLLSQAQGNYVGSEACGVCHQAIHDWWFGSGHAHKLRSPEEARGAGFPQPDGITWDEIWKVIGGHGWKARFIKKDGYIYTTGGKNQFNLATKNWSDYHKDEVKPYKCGPCHMTNYSSSGNQDFRPGAVGTWTFDSIQCEECHGAGKDHVFGGGDKTKITVDRTAAQCGKCHHRGDDDNVVIAKGGFIRHHEQYNEFLKSGHSSTLTCVSCHDPHKTSGNSIKLSCEDCHSDVEAVYKGSKMQLAGVSCEDCHMPEMTKSAVSTRKWVGDVKTHLFKFNLDSSAQPFNASGSAANGYVTSEFGCLVCHYDRDKAWAASYKGVIHSVR